MATNPPPPPTTRTRPRKASTATPGPGGLQVSGTEGAGPSTSSALGGPATAVSMAPPSLSGNGGPTSKEDCEHIVSQLMDPNFRMNSLALLGT